WQEKEDSTEKQCRRTKSWHARPSPEKLKAKSAVLRCIYTDLDGTLLGPGGSLFRAADGNFSLIAARGLEACARAGVEVVIKSGRREQNVMDCARLIGQSAYIFEIGAGLVIDGERTLMTGDWQPRD